MEFEFVDRLPPSPYNDYRPYALAARDNPGHWLKVGRADPRGNIVSGMKRRGLDTETRGGNVYIRAPRPAKPVVHDDNDV